MRGVAVASTVGAPTVAPMTTTASGTPSVSIDWDRFDPTLIDPALVAVVRATCLLESRSDLYRDHLLGVLPERFAAGVERWANEESHHGRALARWLALADPTFRPDEAMQRFLAVPYHDDQGPKRGGPTHELVARCLVEALASTFYLALAAATDEPVLRQICTRLSDDERRHFVQFLGWSRTTSPLSWPKRLGVVARRIAELEDAQISGAAIVARGALGRDAVHARQQHFIAVYSLHRREHLAVAQDLMWEAVGVGPSPCVRRWLTNAGAVAVRLRIATWAWGDAPG